MATGPESAVQGTVEGVKGKAKEIAGAAFDDDDLRNEGRAQQSKAAAQREVAEKEAEADKARAAAKVHDQEQRAHQKG